MDTKAPETRVVTAHIPTDLAEKLDHYASVFDRSKGWIIKQALADWVDWEERKHQMTLEALADVDAGRVIPHEEMVAWGESLGTDHPLPRPSAKFDGK